MDQQTDLEIAELVYTEISTYIFLEMIQTIQQGFLIIMTVDKY